MINLAEILTLLIGCLLALVFIDGIRRAIRIRRSKLKVDLISSVEEGKTDFEEEWQGFNESTEDSISEDVEDEYDLSPITSLNIIHLNSVNGSIFSESSLSQALIFYNFRYEVKGIFTILDSEDKPTFNILNGKNPGTFEDSKTSDDIALVMDSTNLANPIEAFGLFLEVSQSLQDTFQCNILDEDRNLMTKQMIEHMKHQFHEHQRQVLASAS
tara:strand:- start:11 stop:652 length:642 start_codon:yes stop_codon:yes gene_type:complete